MENFKTDLVRKELIPIKILMFLIYGGQATLFPYFTVHLKSLGVSIRQTAIIFSVQPAVALLVSPLVGMLADKTGKFKHIFCFFLTFSALTTNLLLLVPPKLQREKILHFNLKCDSNSETIIELNKGISCEINKDVNEKKFKTSVKFNCHHSCQDLNETLLPLYLKTEENYFPRQCVKGKESECFNIDKNAHLDFLLNIGDLNNSSSTLISENLYMISYKNVTYNSIKCFREECDVNCTFVTKDSADVCLDFLPDENFDVTFWTYFGIRLVVSLGTGLVTGLFDAASMTIIQDLKADVGFQRFWSTIAMCMLAPISGYLVDSFHSYRPCFIMYGCLYIIAAITSLKLDLSMKLPSEKLMKHFVKLMKNPEVILLLIQIAVLGMCWGFLENFLFWFLENELGSNNLIMGLTVTVGSGTGLLMALISTWTTRKLGYVNVILVAFAAYTVRFFGYSLAKDAYTCLIFEMMENFTVTLLTVGVTLYCTELASVEMLTTIMTLWNGLHIVSGRALGSLLGGFLVNNFGFRKCFTFFAYISIGFGAFYAAMYVIWLRNWRKAHRKESEGSRRSASWDSSISKEKEEEAMKNEAFSSLSMHLSLDSPSIIHYLPDLPDFEFRRRAKSHVPVTGSNSFRDAKRVPRHAVSFDHGRKAQPPLSVILETPHFEREDITLQLSMSPENRVYVTKL